MRTPKRLYLNERVIYKPELSACLHCGGPLDLCNHLAWDKTVQTLDGVLSMATRPGFCADPQCPGHHTRLLSAEGQQVAPPGSTYGYDVLAHIGWLRQERRDAYAEIQADLASQIQISEFHVRYLYQQVYLPLLACHERQYWACLAQTARQHSGLIISLDGLAPEGGEPHLWFIRELLAGLNLRSGWLSRFDQLTFEAFLEPLTRLPWPILAVMSDKQKGLPEAVAAVVPSALHQFFHSHYLKSLAEPLVKADSAFNVELRKAVRAEVRLLIRAEKTSPTPQPAVLTVTGLLPDPPQTTPDTENLSMEPVATANSDATIADAVVTRLLRHTRYLLTLKGRPPFRLAGIETYQRLQGVLTLSLDLLAHRHKPRLARLSDGLQTALAAFTSEYHVLRRGDAWLHDVGCILEPPEDYPTTTGLRVAQRLRAHLNDLLTLLDLPPRLDAFRRHLDKVSTSYWPGLFHCYDIEGLPRTNNDLESHFRDTQRRLLRTTGQKGQTRRALQRTGAWELLPRPPAEARCLAALREVPVDRLAQEQQRLRQHQERFACTRDPFDESMPGLINSVNSGSLWQLRPQGDFCGIAFSMT